MDTGLLSLAKERGYRTRVYAIALAEPQLNILRVRQRVLLGGHDVGEVPIVRRYERSLRSMLEGPESADRFVLIDNSSMRFRELARWRAGRITRLRTDLPAWAEILFAAETAKHRSIES